MLVPLRFPPHSLDVDVPTPLPEPLATTRHRSSSLSRAQSLAVMKGVEHEMKKATGQADDARTRSPRPSLVPSAAAECAGRPLRRLR